MNTCLATFAAGCFWGAEESYRTLKGVISTRVGYMGGRALDPTDHDLHHGGFAEVVEVTFDPAQISYEQLLDVFWITHDPTIPNPGGLERSALFYHDGEQRAAAEKSKRGAQGKFAAPIATEIAPASEFHVADEKHQQYLFKHGLASCETQSNGDCETATHR
ncbi:MAG: peptide-methionine (S)-S-oxide reductase MsrA [Chloroflexi bacterium]|nr:peptide-methionine (S)-S-oxide reductase MsrA [Chloroflexota bacterium]